MFARRIIYAARMIERGEWCGARNVFVIDDVLAREFLHGRTTLRSIGCREMRSSFRKRMVLMRNISLALLAVSGIATADLAPAQTAATQYPFCIQGVDNPGYSGCSYGSLQACQASASGTEAECITNPWYSADNSGASASSANPPGQNAPIAIGPPPEN
jgi:hypothetical protein